MSLLKGSAKRLFFQVFRTMVRAVGGRGLGLWRIPFVAAAYKRLYAALHPAGVIAVEAQGSKIYVNAEDRLISAALLTSGVWEATETAIFRSLVKSGMTVLDVGANIGYYTLMAAKLVTPAGRVFAFEPDPWNCQLLARSVESSGYTNVKVYQQAVADKLGRTKLYFDAHNYANRSFFAQNIIQDAGFVEVETIPLDRLYGSGQLGKRVDFLKIDVQGAEALVLAGAEKLLTENLPTILMELEPDKLISAGVDPLGLLQSLEGYRYSISAINGNDGSLQSLPLDQIVQLSESLGGVNVLVRRA